MKRVSINKLRKIYNYSLSKDLAPKLKYFPKYIYLYLSVHLSRDEREFDIHNYNLLKNLYHKSEKFTDTYSNKTTLISGYKKYLLSFKELQYVPSKRLPFLIAIDILKYGKQVLDVLGIALIIYISSLPKSFKKTSEQIFHLKNKKIYSIYYWKKKSSKSAIYYYPNIFKRKENIVFISSFADSRYFCLGLLSSLINSNFLSPAKILNIKEINLSILQFIHLYFYDIYLVIFKRDYHFLKLWVGWKKAAEIFYSILTYNSLRKLTRGSSQCEFISWHENQVTNRSFSLGVSSSIKNNSSNCNLSTFNGTLFTQNTKKQFLPLESEVKIGFWGQKYYLQDQGSLEEMKSFLKYQNLKISLKVVPESMLRTKSIKTNEKYKIQISRTITVFTHASYWDLISCILSIFNNKNKSLSYPRKVIKKEKCIFIRLHPSLNKKDAIKEIKRIREIPSYMRYEFIENDKESFLKSIKLSRYSFFGDSTYVNLAIETGSKVFSVDSNHISESPIKSELINFPNLTKISPW